MASGAEISVAVERAVHDGLRELAENLWTSHGIILRAARFDWLDVSTADKPQMALTDIEADTATKAGR